MGEIRSSIFRLPRRGRALGAALCASVLLGAGAVSGAPAPLSDGATAVVLASAGDEETQRTEGKLEPRYQPREPEEKSWYNSDYLFGMTRGVADSTIHPAGKVPLFVLTVPLDIALLPFAAIGGLFG